MATAKAEVAEELRKACDAREVKLPEDLQFFQAQKRRLEAQVKDLEDKLIARKASTTELKMKLSDSDSRRRIVEERVRVLKAKVMAA